MADPFMQQAIELAIENVRAGRGGPFGAVIARNGVAIATGTNSVTSSNDPTAHAEVMAIRAASRALAAFDLSGCEIYTSCEPCPMCLGAIYWARLDRVYYAARSADAREAGFDDSRIYDELKLQPAMRSIAMINTTCDRALAPFEVWLASPNRTEY